MGILGALSTAVSGLSAQSYSLENISGNIANSQTVGFKRVNTNFVDFVPDTPAKHDIAGSVVSYSSLTTTIQGTLHSTGVATNMALSGDGYFVVSKNTGTTAKPAFTQENLYTRRGDFTTDANGYLRNGSGLFLDGTSYNPATGAVTGSLRQPIQISNTALPAVATTTINYSSNLPTVPKPGAYSSATSGSHLIHATDFNTTTNPVTTGSVLGSDESTFLNETIPGGEIAVYSQTGTASTAQLRWAKVSDYTPAAGATPASPATWKLFYQTNSNAASTDIAWKSVGSDVTFDASGARTSASNITISNMSIDGNTIGNVKLDFTGGLTQYSDTNGTTRPTISQDGSTPGTLSSMAISSDGILTGTYSNGKTAKLAQVTVAHFAASDSLKRQDGGAYSETVESGGPTYGLNGTTLSGGSVEESNTDISDEFSKMIVTQQAYSANTRVMSTAQSMLQDIINVIR